MDTLRDYAPGINYGSEIFATDQSLVLSPSCDAPAPPADGPPGDALPTDGRTELQRAVAELQAFGFATCRVNDKGAYDAKWPTFSAAADTFGSDDGVGIIGGPLSAPPGHSLVVIDIDDERVREAAPRHLPPTLTDAGPGASSRTGTTSP